MTSIAELFALFSPSRLGFPFLRSIHWSHEVFRPKTSTAALTSTGVWSRSDVDGEDADGVVTLRQEVAGLIWPVPGHSECYQFSRSPLDNGRRAPKRNQINLRPPRGAR
jgi:hypothetical protein